MSHIHPYSLLVPVTAAAGTGSATFKATGQLISISIKPASGTPTYDFDITDSGGYGVVGRTALSGNSTIITTVVVNDTYTITVSNATLNIVYNFKLWFIYGT